jgi:hypothetical protein
MVEHDPSGIEQHTVGAKLDAGKDRSALVLSGFSKALTDVIKVGSAGANKYTPNGWKDVENGASRYEDALMRHLMKHWNGEEIDPNFGCTHLAHAAWNLLAIIEFKNKES